MGGQQYSLLQMGGSDFDKCTGVHPLTDGRFQYRPFIDGRFDRGAVYPCLVWEVSVFLTTSTYRWEVPVQVI